MTPSVLVACAATGSVMAIHGSDGSGYYPHPVLNPQLEHV